MGYNKKIQMEMDKGVDALLHTNAAINLGTASDIQRKGQSLPGDTGQNFGLNNMVFRNIHNQYNGQLIGNGLGLTFAPFSNLAGKNATENRTYIAHHKMAMCAEAYRGFGVIKNVIDLMCNFASEGITIQHKRPAIRKFYARWAEIVDLPGRVKDILREYYKYGNVFIYRTMATIDEQGYKKMRTAKGKLTADSMDPYMKKRIEQAEDENLKIIGNRQIPWRYTLLNPFQMHLRGSEFFGESQWLFKMDEARETSSPNGAASIDKDILDETKVNLPPEFKDALAKKEGMIKLDQTKLFTLHYMKDDHEDWADPLVWPVIGDVLYKNKLRAMDMSVCDSAISAVTIFKLGNLKEGFIAPPEHFRKFAEMLRTPTHAMNMVWNDAISVESSYPPVEKILGVAKYEAVDSDILKGLGIPEILMGGKGGNFSNSFVSVRTLLERLEEGRNEVMKWINKELRLIATVMGHRDIPTVRFGQMSLRDETAEKKLILDLLDRDIISVEAVHEVFGQDFEIELERMKSEKQIRDEEDILIKHGPFTDPMTDLEKEGEMDKQFKHQEKLNKQTQEMKQSAPGAGKKPVGVKKKNGRPSGTKDIKHKKKRVTKPKGMAAILSRYEELKAKGSKIYSEVDAIMANKTLELKGVKYKKSLSSQDREALDGLTYAIFTHLNPSDVVTESLIMKTLSTYGSETNGYIGGMVVDGTFEEKKNIRVANWATFHMDVEIEDEDNEDEDNEEEEEDTDD